LIHDLLLEIRTGNDDLRGGGDNLNITVNFNDKPAQTLLNINKGGRWINNYTETVPIHLTTPVLQAELKAIVFNTTFHGGIDGDNWNMDMVRVLKADGTEILKKSGSPLFRFTGDAKLYSLPFGAAGPVPGGKISRLDFEIKTGGDDLRGGNDNLNIRVAYKDGTYQMAGNVNKGTNWDNNTIKYVSVDLDRPIPLDQLRNITLSTTFGGGMGGDNWNMQYIIVQAISGATAREIYRKEGNPLKRFTGSDKFYAINF
jgi:hypothetical protein